MEGRTQPMPPTVSQACTALIARMLVPRAEGRASLEVGAVGGIRG